MDLGTSRRSFLKSLAVAFAAGRTLLSAGDVRAALDAATAAVDPPADWPKLGRTPLGKTGFEASRLVFGCGAALAKRPHDALLDAAFEAGINVFDVGYRGYYDDAEKNLAPFVARHRDRVFLISKARVGVDLSPDEAISPEQAKEAATTWQSNLHASLRELGVEQVDAYYVMAANNASLVASDEILAAADRARRDGKIRFLGLSTHQNQQRVLESAMKTGQYGLAMIAVTPAGWYDWESKGIAEDARPMTELQPFLARVRESGIGLVGMKAGRYLAGRWYFGGARPDAFDEHYDPKLLAANLSAFQRSYAYVLAHGLDVVNADMQSMAHLRENVVAAATSASYFA